MVGRSRHRLKWAGCVALTLTAALGLFDWCLDTQRDLAHARSLKSTPYVGSTQCKHCHPSHYESFARTYHSRMTREANAQTVLGAFDGRSVEYLGTVASMTRSARGDEFWMSFQRKGDAAATRVRVERSVGSHRYQQYLARDGDIYFRLPIAWDVARHEFFHMNGAFLTADPETPASGVASTIDYNRHVTRWNDNCIYCHNVHPNPGLDTNTGEFDTQVAELGVACEACHGPGGEHAARNSDPIRRYALHNSGAADPSIRNPRRMSAAHSAEVCGRCHGQRITPDIERFHREGDPFVPGEDLALYSKPLARDTRQNGEPGMFQARFWPDGTARLTAYEYQGYLQSPCRASDQFSCESCHAMHEGDPAGQLRPERTGDEACTTCHGALRSVAAASAHAKHPPDSSGTRCINCHMPEIVYGLVSIHVSHRIESPDPQLQAANSRPDACTLCHIDRTRSWAIDARKQNTTARGALRNQPAPSIGYARAAARTSYHSETPREREPDASAPARDEQIDPIEVRRATNTAGSAYAQIEDSGANVGLSEMAYQLLAGDPIERAVAAHALGKPEAAATVSFRPMRLGLLLDSAEHDPYPAVRSVARASLEQLLAANASARSALATFVPTARLADRQRVLRAVRAAMGPTAVSDPSPAIASELRSRAASAAIEIGE